MKVYKKFFFIVILSTFINHSYAKTPIEFISEITNNASGILKENITVDHKAEKLIILAESAVDIDGIGLYSLGKHRKLITEEKLSLGSSMISIFFERKLSHAVCDSFII